MKLADFSSVQQGYFRVEKRQANAEPGWRIEISTTTAFIQMPSVRQIVDLCHAMHCEPELSNAEWEDA